MRKKRLLAFVLACAVATSGNISVASADPSGEAVSADDASDEAVTTAENGTTAVADDSDVSSVEKSNNFRVGEAYDGDITAEAKTFTSDVFDYTKQRAEYEEKGYKSVSADTEIKLDIEDAVGKNPFVFEEGELTLGKSKAEKVKGVQFFEKDDNTDCPYVEWTFNVEETGLYEMYMNYKAESSYGTTIQRKIEIDGEVPFDDLYNVYLTRRFEENKDGFDSKYLDKGEYRVKTNAIGNEIMPSHTELEVWQQNAITDNEGYYEDPMQFYFEKGEHTIRISYVDQNIVLGNVYLRGSKEYDTYEQYQKDNDSKKDNTGKDTEVDRVQAENALWTSEGTIRRDTDTDPKTQSSYGTDNSATTQMLNIIGGSRWQSGNQTIAWQVEVPEDGYYTINMRSSQSSNAGMPSYRQIKIDGEIPFEDMKLYEFEYISGWHATTLGKKVVDKDGKAEVNSDGSYKRDAYKFYLTKGTHEISMTVKSGDVYEIVSRVNEAISLTSAAYLDITRITGTSPDSNVEYNLKDEMPELPKQFNEIADVLQECSDYLKNISNQTTEMQGNFDELISMFHGYANDPDLVVDGLSDLEDTQTTLGDYILNIGDMPLTLDYIDVKPAADDSEYTIAVGGMWQKLWYSILNFFSSFVKNYDAVGTLASEDGDYESITVWIARGREWGEVLKSLADETFLEQYKTSVALNILPSGQLNAGNVSALMLAITSHHAPDAAVGISYSDPVEYAYRDAIIDLTQFDDFEEAKDQFYDTMFVPYTYVKDGHEGVFALPETMDFTVMMYRTDVFESLELDVPETWDELWSDTLPVLIENSMSFAFPVDTTASSNSPSSLKGMTMYLIQGGGAYYRDTKESDGSYIAPDDPVQGLYSNLDTPEAFAAFEKWTDMYVDYGIDAESSFFTRFRTGTLPIGIGSYASYMQVLTTAPELYGRWSVAPMLGVRQEDGSIDNRVGGISLTACQVMEQSEKQQAAWNFIKWWMSEDTQIEYGNEIEATMGIEARWNSANKNAFENLPWDEDDIKVIQGMMGKAVEQPIVLGGYFTTRHLVNAWNRVYLSNEEPRDSLEEAVKDINKELRTKHEEYGVGEYED